MESVVQRGTDFTISASESKLYFKIVSSLNIACMLKVLWMRQLQEYHTHTHTHDERVDISFFLKKVCPLPVFQLLKNICLSFVSCVFWQHVFCTIHRKILFGRFSQNEACFWKWLPQIFVKKQYDVYFKCLCIIVTYYGS